MWPTTLRPPLTEPLHKALDRALILTTSSPELMLLSLWRYRPLSRVLYEPWRWSATDIQKHRASTQTTCTRFQSFPTQIPSGFTTKGGEGNKKNGCLFSIFDCPPPKSLRKAWIHDMRMSFLFFSQIPLRTRDPLTEHLIMPFSRVLWQRISCCQFTIRATTQKGVGGT